MYSAVGRKGEIEPDDKLSKFIPEISKADSVTIHMLLNHTSGIANFTDIPEFLKVLRLSFDKDFIISLLKNRPYDFPPGTNNRYSNSGYFLLACIVEKVSGQKYGDFLEQNIFSKLKMTGTGVDQFESVISKRARGYRTEEKTWNCDFVNVDWFLGCGNLYSTVGDLYKWDRALYGNSILTSESRNKMFTPGRDHYGYGIVVDSLLAHKRTWHNGDIAGFNCSLTRYINDDVCMIILSNNQSNLRSVSIDMAHILFDTPAYFIAQKAIFIKQLRAADNDQGKRKAQWQLNNLKAIESERNRDSIAQVPYVGEYGNGINFYIRGRKLYCRNRERDNKVFELRYVEGDLYVLDENVEVEFIKDSKGKVSGIKMFWINGNVSYLLLKEELDRRANLWKLNYQKSLQLHQTPDSSFLAPFAGTYQGGLDFYMSGRDLYCKNPERGNDIFKLIHIAENLFQLDENVQVEFLKAETGNIYSIKMLWRWGDENIKPREK